MLSSLDYYYLMQELQILNRARISKIYEDDEKREIFLFEFHVPSVGTKWLQLVVPQVMFLTENKITPESPPGFCQFLRKKIQGLIVQKIGLVGFERIIRIDIGIRDETLFKLYIEMFSKGNLILTDKDEKIIGTWKTKHYGSRSVRGGTTYELPPGLNNTIDMTKKELEGLIHNNKKELVKFCATTLGLGGYYSEMLLQKTGIDKTISNLDEKQLEKLHIGIKELFSQKISPLTDDEPHALGGKKPGSLSVELEKFYQEKLFEVKQDNTKERISEAQIKKIEEYEKSAEENQKRGELIYENYVQLQKILSDAKKGEYNNCEKIDHHTIKVKIND